MELEKIRERNRRSQQKALRKKRSERSKQKREFYATDKKTRREAATRWCHKYIKLRDRNQPCISCGTTKKNIRYDAGHYISAGSNSLLRWDSRNIHKQCSFNCNHHLSGNRGGYREGLIKRYGQELVDFLEGPHEPVKRTAADYKKIEDHYKAKVKELEKEIERAAESGF